MKIIHLEKYIFVGFAFYGTFCSILLWERLNAFAKEIIPLSLALTVLIIITSYLASYFLSFQSNVRLLFYTNHTVIVGTRESGTFHKIKRIWKYDSLFFAKLFLCLLAMIFLTYPAIFLSAYLHEINHSLVALFYGVDVITIGLNPTGSAYMSIPNIEYPPEVMSNILLAGTLGTVILFSLLFLIILISRNHLKVEVFIPLCYLVGFSLFLESNGWYMSIINQHGDAWNFLLVNPSINLPVATITSFCVYILLNSFFTSYVVLHLGSRVNKFFRDYIPDLTTFF